MTAAVAAVAIGFRIARAEPGRTMLLGAIGLAVSGGLLNFVVRWLNRLQGPSPGKRLDGTAIAGRFLLSVAGVFVMIASLLVVLVSFGCILDGIRRLGESL